MNQYYKNNNVLWGASTSAFQVEGECNTHGKGLSIVDINSFENNHTFADTSIAADHYNHVDEDIEMMKELGLQSYRFSISWTRILPNGDNSKINTEGVEFYKNLITKLKLANIEPIATIYHFDFPLQLQEKYSGWYSREVLTDFVNYAKFLFTCFGEDIKYWIIINEQNLALRKDEHLGIKHIEESIEKEKIRHQMNYHMFLASSLVTDLCHKMCPNALIGPAISYFPTYPETNKPEDVLAAYEAENLFDHYILDTYIYGGYPVYYQNYLKKINCYPKIESGDIDILKKGKPDFIGFNYYLSMCAKAYGEDEKEIETVAINQLKIPGYFKNVSNTHLKSTEYGWPIDEIGFRKALYALYDRYHLPLMITENGFGGKDKLIGEHVNDQYRIDFLDAHTHQLLKAIDDGIPVLSYNVWSYMDVLSTHSGFSKRYGLVYIDRDEKDPKKCSRVKKASFYWYQNFIKTRKKPVIMIK